MCPFYCDRIPTQFFVGFQAFLGVIIMQSSFKPRYSISSPDNLKVKKASSHLTTISILRQPRDSGSLVRKRI
jgi:hypothetical protein